MEKLLTPKEVARLLGIKPSTVYLWASTGHIPAIKLKQGKRKTVWRFSREAIETWLKVKTEYEKRKN